MSNSSDTKTAPLHAEEAVRGFAQLDRGQVDYAGGKGANLGELTAAGLPVPPGFVVGAPAYAAFCDSTGLRARITERLSSLDVDDTAALERAAVEVREMVEATAIPDWLATAIRDSYLTLVGEGTDAPVAVRSSATAEDTASYSVTCGHDGPPRSISWPSCTTTVVPSAATTAAW